MNRVQEEILSLITEDHYGLWEIAIQVPVDRTLLASAIRELLNDGLAEWFVRVGDSSPASALVESDNAEPDVDDGALWVAPLLEQRHIMLGATDDGYARYFSSTQGEA